MMLFKNDADDRKTEAAAVAIRPTSSVEGLEDVAQLRLRDARTCVFDLYQGMVTLAENLHINSPILRRMSERIVEQIAEQDRESRRIHPNRNLIDPLEPKIHLTRLRDRKEVSHHLFRDPVDICDGRFRCTAHLILCESQELFEQVGGPANPCLEGRKTVLAFRG